jgi:hypothetical protein
LWKVIYNLSNKKGGKMVEETKFYDTIFAYKGEEYNKLILYQLYNHKLRLKDRLYYYNMLVDINGNFLGSLFHIDIDINGKETFVRYRKNASGFGNIYKIENIRTKKIYIGESNDIYQRKNLHYTSLQQEKHQNADMQLDYLLYGIDDFYFEIIEKIDFRKDMLLREKYWINFYNSEYPNGYNYPKNRKNYQKREAKTFMNKYRSSSQENKILLLHNLKVEKGLL